MAEEVTAKYAYRKPEGMWSKVFSNHSFEPIMERAEGIYLYDTDGKRYIDVSAVIITCSSATAKSIWSSRIGTAITA